MRVKKIEAIIKPFRLDELKEELVDLGVDGVTVTEVRGARSSRDARAGTFEPDYVPRMKIEIVAPDEQTPQILRVLQRIAGTGSLPGEEIVVIAVEQSVRVRTASKDPGR